MYDIIIIGAGPAGLTSALYAGRANKKTLLLEAKCYGGQIINSNEVENYPGFDLISGFDLANNMYKQVKALNVDYKTEKVIEIIDNHKVITNKGQYSGKTIIIATGLERRKLNIPGEEDFQSKGVSYCAICDGHFFKNKDVAIVGGGNTALEEALYLSDIVNKVYIVHRSKFRADEILVDRVEEKNNIECLLNTNIVSINGEVNVEKIIVLNNISNESKEIDVSAVFVAIGLNPSNIDGLNDIDIKDGYVVSSDCRTNVESIFVAGDCRTKELRQLTTACADGAIAANMAINYLNNSIN